MPYMISFQIPVLQAIYLMLYYVNATCVPQEPIVQTQARGYV